MKSPLTFVLVHGAWHGGWCWRRVADLLRKDGHLVFTPTLTGFGERVHLIRPDLTLEDFATDLVNDPAGKSSREWPRQDLHCLHEPGLPASRSNT